MRRIALVLTSLLVAGTASAQERTMNGRYVRGAGERPGKMSEGTFKGDMGFEPYSGSYLPRHEGPLAKEKDEEVRAMIENGFDGCDLVHRVIKQNAKKSTAAKFEKADEAVTGWDSDFVARYKAEGYDRKAETWEGFCHNWAPAGLDATINFMVSMDKIYADVPFGVGDLRELVTYAYPGESGSWDSYVWFGKRHDAKNEKEKPEDEFDPVDIITMLRNYVGKNKPGIVFDVDPGYMVWNQPVYKWSMTSKEVKRSTGPKKPPQGGKAFRVKVEATYGLEGEYAYRGETISGSKTWNMYVYTDARGNIVDSAWDKDRPSDDIPDFAWMNTKLGTSEEFERLKDIAENGISVKSIEEFCKTMASLPQGNISRANARKLKKLLDEICPVLDQNKLTKLIRETAERTGQDYTVLEAAIRSEVDAHI